MRLGSPSVLLILATALLPQEQSYAAGGERLMLPSAVAAAAAAAMNATMSSHPVPAQFVVTNATLGSFLRQVASPNEQAIIFTTTRLPAHGVDAELGMLSNFCYWLDRAGVLNFTMLLTTDNATFYQLHARGYPAVLDRVFPERQEYRDGDGSAPDTPNRVFDVQKHYWGSVIVSHGFRALYMDSDAVVLQNPLSHFSPAYDVQGLSDWGGAELPKVGDVLHTSCGLYSLIPDNRVGLGSMLREWWRYAPGDKERALNGHNPCQSTGLWFVEPTPMAIRFMAAMRDRLLAPATRHQWDQTAWNEVVVPFLWGAGEEPPLRYRLLPPASFAGGVHNYEERLKAGLPVDPVVIHSGGLHGGAKQATYERLGLFCGNFSLPTKPLSRLGGMLGAAQRPQELEGLAAQGQQQGEVQEVERQEQELPTQQQVLAAARLLTVPKAAIASGRSSSGSSTGMVAVAAVLGVVGAAGCLTGLLMWRRAAALNRRPVVKGPGATRQPGFGV